MGNGGISTSRGQSDGGPSLNNIDGDNLQQFWAILEASRNMVRKNPLIRGKVSASYLVGGKIEEIRKQLQIQLYYIHFVGLQGKNDRISGPNHILDIVVVSS